MAELDVLAPNYRRARQRWPDAPMLARGYDALSVCFSSNAHGLVEHVKSFIECVCLTIMGEFRVGMPSAQPSTTELLVTALGALGMKNARGAAKLDKVLSGFNRLADAISEMRNESGPVAHGKDGFLDSITVDHARAFLHAGDAILGALLNAFDGEEPDLIATREPYERFQHLNDRIDRAVAMHARIDEDGDRPTVVVSVATGPRSEAIELRVEPSRLLYGIDREAYVEVLNTVESVTMEEAVGGDARADMIEGATPKAAVASIASIGEPVTEFKAAYKGNLVAFRHGVEALLQAEGVDPATTDEGGSRLIDSLLATAEQNMALDWKEREVMLARLKVACKRVLTRFGLGGTQAEVLADRFVSWLRVQVSDDALAVPGRAAIERGAVLATSGAPASSSTPSSAAS